MQKPRALRAGDRVAVVAPASPLDMEVVKRGSAELRRLGFTPVVDRSTYARDRYVAGRPEVRAEALAAAWTDPDIAGVFVTRGGYGSVQLLPLLDHERFRTRPKVFVGSSDLTAVLTWLTGRCDTVGFHGPMLVNLARGAEADEGYDRRSLLGAVTTPEPLGELAPGGLDVVCHGEARGPLLGGTLSLLLASLATPFSFSPPDGYVLLIDEINERPYRIDRMLTQIVQSGLLRKASAVVCSEFQDCCSDDDYHARDVIAETLRSFPGPVVFGFPTGHTRGPMSTAPLGITTAVMTRPVPRIVIEEAAVS